MGKKLLSKLFKCLESASSCIYFCAVLLQGAEMCCSITRAGTDVFGTPIGKCQKKRNICWCLWYTYLWHTWCLSNKASAPVTSFASSSEETRPRMPLIQDMRSLWTHRNRELFPPSTEMSHNRESSPLLNPSQKYSCGTISQVYSTNNKQIERGNHITTWSHWGNAAGHGNLPASPCAGQLVSPDYSKPGSAQCIFLGDLQQILDVTGLDAGQFHQENSPRITEREMNTVKTERTAIVQSFLVDKKKAFGFSSSESHLVSQSCQVSLKAFMFALQSLNTGQVMPIVVCI